MRVPSLNLVSLIARVSSMLSSSLLPGTRSVLVCQAVAVYVAVVHFEILLVLM